MPRAARPPYSGCADGRHTALPGAAARLRPRRRGSGSRGRRRGRSRAARRARRSPRPPAGGRRSERPSPRGRPAHASRWDGAPARWHRASGGGGPRRTRPAGGRGWRCARGRRRSRRSAAPGARRARRARHGVARPRSPARNGRWSSTRSHRVPNASRSVRIPASSCTPCCAQPVRQASPSACAHTCASVTAGAVGSRGRTRVAAWAIVSRRQRLRQPCSLATSSVRWRPSSRLTSAPWIGRSPTARAACANSIEPWTAS